MSGKKKMRKVPKSIKSLLIAVRERAKELRCMSHPRDRECLYKFIVACHKAGTNFNGYDLYSHLIASGGCRKPF